MKSTSTDSSSEAEVFCTSTVQITAPVPPNVGSTCQLLDVTWAALRWRSSVAKRTSPTLKSTEASVPVYPAKLLPARVSPGGIGPTKVKSDASTAPAASWLAKLIWALSTVCELTFFTSTTQMTAPSPPNAGSG